MTSVRRHRRWFEHCTNLYLNENLYMPQAIEKVGGPGRDRTDDLMTASHARSQLRHRPLLNEIAKPTQPVCNMRRKPCQSPAIAKDATLGRKSPPGGILRPLGLVRSGTAFQRGNGRARVMPVRRPRRAGRRLTAANLPVGNFPEHSFKSERPLLIEALASVALAGRAGNC